MKLTNDRLLYISLTKSKSIYKRNENLDFFMNEKSSRGNFTSHRNYFLPSSLIPRLLNEIIPINKRSTFIYFSDKVILYKRKLGFETTSSTNKKSSQEIEIFFSSEERR